MEGVVRATMEDVRKRFAEYKSQRATQERSNSGKRDQGERRTQENAYETSKASVSRVPIQHHDSKIPTPAENSSDANVPVSPPPPSGSVYVTLLKILLWGLLWGFFIEVGFGAVFLITSLLYFIITSLRGSRRKPWEPSAYSVFNRNFEAIEGTLSAEQFERELRYGPMNVKK